MLSFKTVLIDNTYTETRVSKHKEVLYRRHDGAVNPPNMVAYQRYGKRIIWTGLHNGANNARGSTINFAETIILAIAETEDIDPRKCEFYDLQTHRGYTSHKPGDFTFNRVLVRWETGASVPTIIGWVDGRCLLGILAEWSKYIWGDTPPGTPRNLAEMRETALPLLAEV